ncbi:hypothetical protein BDV38DRAFT_133369 [Aspergillus pseudotamarii]|uniref:Uncharacterized protein n=1 Tax=Aspergillus pseudotamarii TaxID=132259 RepID=A0A5N6SQY8_ASPPS|nr:uncharacterized protein BDV38DRAFT_133369 [Aspergillus pseudotamarii]KAE8135793.1 hypothetical protein BDV38DRAFT_133369 [Aspergillus pseudotamarii]
MKCVMLPSVRCKAIDSTIFFFFCFTLLGCRFLGICFILFVLDLVRSSPTQGILPQHIFTLSRNPRFVTWSLECCYVSSFPPYCVQTCVVGGLRILQIKKYLPLESMTVLSTNLMILDGYGARTSFKRTLRALWHHEFSLK